MTEQTATTNTLVRRADTATAGSLDFAANAWGLAQRLAPTSFMPKDYRNKPDEALACILYGNEVGFDVMQSLTSIHVIEGRPSLSAEAMRALVLAAGHELWIAESTNTSVTVGGRRAGQTRETTMTWTMDDARKAGLDGKQNWRKYPRAMLTARATAAVVRAVFPDIIRGLSYTSEELTDGDVIDATVSGQNIPAPAPAHAPSTGTTTMTADAPAVAPATPSAPPQEDPPPAEAPPLPGEDDDVLDAEVIIDNPLKECPNATAIGRRDRCGFFTDPPRCRLIDGPGPDGMQMSCGLIAVTNEPAEADEPATDDVSADPFPPDPEPPVEEGARLTAQGLIALRTGELDLDRDAKLILVSDIIGRHIESTNALSDTEAADVIRWLEGAGTDDVRYAQLKADEARVAASAGVDEAASTGGVEVETPTPADPPAKVSGDIAPTTADGWRNLCGRHKVTMTKLLKHASTVADRTVPTLDDLVDLLADAEPAERHALAEWVAAAGKK